MHEESHQTGGSFFCSVTPHSLRGPVESDLKVFSFMGIPPPRLYGFRVVARNDRDGGAAGGECHQGEVGHDESYSALLGGKMK